MAHAVSTVVVDLVRSRTQLSLSNCAALLPHHLQVAQLSQRDRATHELLGFAKLRSGIFEPSFWGLRGNVDASCVSRWKKRGRLSIGDNWTF